MCKLKDCQMLELMVENAGSKRFFSSSLHTYLSGTFVDLMIQETALPTMTVMQRFNADRPAITIAMIFLVKYLMVKNHCSSCIKFACIFLKSKMS